ncbi:tRNA 2-selenouridine(34) synthase MnmH [Bacillus sp. FJAT-49732]|uniref:tRNA 2-selenouridine(34) synthase MnmH n=1 Tax=Lederbergia citrisecunda TaxID=2833583 RepID=A0A942TQT3_9BACI|nr:tRNA 2-selenouridine(34) synthase MnmH [Lederbergia citrisecunda]MBS4201853.1 tRNA 2-selenouridine(34) synthase MnmH [Lederbergia citrisecunda]
MFRDIAIEDMMAVREKGEMVLIDVRSPSEFNHSTIPGSLNIPLFNDEERAEIGTLYKQVSPEAAQDRGLEIVSAKLPDFIKAFKQLNREITVFCWRGGMRSKTSATVLDLMNVKVNRLQGGVRAYRKWVVDKMERMDLSKKAFILNGNTGTGKTLILRKLQKEGYPVIDLEQMANHRGSIFGQIGLNPHNQKTFDSLLVERLEQLQDSSYVLFEGESKRIGKAVLPQALYDMKEKGTQIFIELPMEERVQQILDDYSPWEYKSECMEAFRKIKSRIHTPIATQIEECLHSEEFSLAVRLLLEYYYDPRYKFTADQYPESQKVMLHVQHVDEAVEQIKKLIGQSVKSGHKMASI